MAMIPHHCKVWPTHCATSFRWIQKDSRDVHECFAVQNDTLRGICFQLPIYFVILYDNYAGAYGSYTDVDWYESHSTPWQPMVLRPVTIDFYEASNHEMMRFTWHRFLMNLQGYTMVPIPIATSVNWYLSEQMLYLWYYMIVHRFFDIKVLISICMCLSYRWNYFIYLRLFIGYVVSFISDWRKPHRHFSATNSLADACICKTRAWSNLCYTAII